ncbi:lipase/esterase [Secundilactobacillus oryzae JCM 18671]|uniref:Lipase/esterase n=1 Tax=Secundilactobacillus oryzae JCM 18671 TaxID=1291743 RepID=A0A081BKD2_9LACO|nr:alpha/beta fold hydrolase [Secundilactobacillus oryzae]GAK48500.1 lipase/esterase [Secundilactobacillus oryzae JCM 18671]
MFKAQTPFLFEHGPRAVILLHAYASGPNDVRMLARALERENFTVYAPKFTGHATGEPLDILREGNPDRWRQDVRDAIAYMTERGYRELSIFGLSLGGAYAIKALEEVPELVGGGAFSSPVMADSFVNISAEFYRLAKMTYDAQAMSEAVQAERRQLIQAELPGQLATIDALMTKITVDLSSISQPTFIAQGGQDELVAPDSGQKLAQHLVNSQVTYQYYEEATHALTVNSAHKQLEVDLIQFLKSIYSNEE